MWQELLICFTYAQSVWKANNNQFLHLYWKLLCTLVITADIEGAPRKPI